MTGRPKVHMAAETCVDCDAEAHTRCAQCQCTLCPSHAHYYVDGQNRAITKAARPKCIEHKGAP